MFSYVNWLQNGGSLNFERSKRGPIYLIKQKFFKHFEIWPATIFDPVDLGKRYMYTYLKSPKTAIEFFNKFWDISDLLASILISVKVRLFQLRGRGNQ